MVCRSSTKGHDQADSAPRPCWNWGGSRDLKGHVGPPPRLGPLGDNLSHRKLYHRGALSS